MLKDGQISVDDLLKNKYERSNYEPTDDEEDVNAQVAVTEQGVQCGPEPITRDVADGAAKVIEDDQHGRDPAQPIHKKKTRPFVGIG